MKTLFVITTHDTPLNNKAEGILFNKKNSKPYDYKTEALTEYFQKNRTWYRLDGKNGFAFGHTAFPTDKVMHDKNEYLKALCLEVKAQLNSEQIKEIGEIIFLLHAHELKSDDWFKQQDRNIVDKVKEYWGDNGGIYVKVKVIAFKHNEDYAFSRFLKKSYTTEQRDLIDQLRYIVDRALEHIPLDSEEKQNAFRPDSILESELENYLKDFSITVLKPIIREGRLKFDDFSSKGKTDDELTEIENFKKSCLGKFEDWTLDKTRNAQNQLKMVFLPIGFLEDDRMMPLLKEIYLDTEIKKGIVFPVLFLGYYDLMNERHSKINQIDARYRFLDSSIWRRYAPIEDGGRKLLQALKAFHWAYQKNLYKKNVCKEYNEFTWRLFQNSYLDPNQGDGHSSYVKPFLFHSESLMEQKANQLAQDFRNRQLHWSLIFFDDHCNNCLKEEKEIPQPVNGQLTKGELVKEIITHGIETHEKKPGIIEANRLPCETDIHNAKNFFTHPKNENYDIILLDYLFSHAQRDDLVHFGSELITFIEEHEGKGLYNIGPQQKYWIFPTTAFPEAMQSDFMGKSIQHIEKKWQLARGADPINTPLLFRCALLEFMKAQVDVLLFDEKSLWRFVADNKLTDGNCSNTQKIAADIFRRFLYRFSTLEGLTIKSGLGASLWKQILSEHGQFKRSYELMEKLRNVYYLIAYSTGYDANVLRRDMRLVTGFYETAPEDFFIDPDSSSNEGQNWKQKVENALHEIGELVYGTKDKYF